MPVVIDFIAYGYQIRVPNKNKLYTNNVGLKTPSQNKYM